MSLSTIKKKNLRFFTFILLIFLLIFLITNTIIISSSILKIDKINSFKKSVYKNDTKEKYIVINGIPMIDYGYKKNIYVGIQLYPLGLARYAQGNISAYLRDSRNTEALESAIFLGDWLIENKVEKNSFDWENNSLVNYNMWVSNFSVPYPKMPIEKPFYSALAQGHIIDLFVNLYKITNQSKYHDHAFFALNAFKVEIKEGGLLKIEEPNKFWLPEIVELHHPERLRYVLGGFVHTIKNLIEIRDLTNSESMKFYINRLVNFTIANLEDKIQLYSYKDIWTYYDRVGHIASDFYNDLNTFYLGWLYNQTQSPEIYDAWQLLYNSPHETFPKNFGWYIRNMFSETKIWWPYSFTISIIILFISSPIWYIARRKIYMFLEKNLAV
ncbi:MAG: hypothetical protein HZR80_13595 [Candidatus Heimdallarchaeota archaeon]